MVATELALQQGKAKQAVMAAPWNNKKRAVSESGELHKIPDFKLRCGLYGGMMFFLGVFCHPMVCQELVGMITDDLVSSRCLKQIKDNGELGQLLVDNFWRVL